MVPKIYISLLGVYSEGDLEEAEISAILTYDSYHKGYNATKGGDGRRYLAVSENQIIELYNKF